MFRPSAGSGSAVTFAPCIYDDAKKQEFIHRALQCFLNVSQNKWNEAKQEFMKIHGSGTTEPDFGKIMDFANAAPSGQEYMAQLKIGLVETRRRIFRLAGLLKHRAFHQEREWRLVLPISPNSDKTNLILPIRFRSTNASLIPYVEYPLGLFSMGAPPTPLLPVNDVLLGPGASDDAANAALDFLKSKSIKIVPRRSDVPYRQV